MEFEDFLEVVMSKDLDEEDHELALKEAFKMFDRDGNGYIDADELRLCMMNLGEKLTLEEVEEMIREVDVDYDGRMNYEGMYKLDKRCSTQCESNLLKMTSKIIYSCLVNLATYVLCKQVLLLLDILFVIIIASS